MSDVWQGASVVNKTFCDLLNFYSSVDAKRYIYAARLDFLAGYDRFPVGPEVDITRSTYIALVYAMGGICESNQVALPWSNEVVCKPWESGERPIKIDPEVIVINDDEVSDEIFEEYVEEMEVDSMFTNNVSPTSPNWEMEKDLNGWEVSLEDMVEGPWKDRGNLWFM
jgi:hypothetical protein